MRAFFVAAAFLIASAAHAQDASFVLKGEQFAGEWTVSDNNPSGGCKLNLDIEKSPFGYPAHAFGCTADDLLNVTRWSLRGTSIVLSDDRGTVFSALKIKDRNRYEGRSSAGRRIVMSR